MALKSGAIRANGPNVSVSALVPGLRENRQSLDGIAVGGRPILDPGVNSDMADCNDARLDLADGQRLDVDHLLFRGLEPGDRSQQETAVADIEDAGPVATLIMVEAR